MNFNNIYLLDHQQLSGGAYRTNTSLQSNIAQLKPTLQSQLNPAHLTDQNDKVIFKVESDHLNSNNNNNNGNFKLNTKQFKIINKPQETVSSYTIQPQYMHTVKEEPKEAKPEPLVEVNQPVETMVSLGGDASEHSLSIYVNNVVCSYSTRCHLNLRRIAMEGMHVEYKKENGMVNMKLRKPYTTATIWSSGKITCAGAKSEADAYKAARRFCRMLQSMQFKVKMMNYRVVNVLATCNMPFGVDIQKLAENYQKECSYEPELHPGATFKIAELKATLKLFTTGSITLTAPSVQAAQTAIKQIYPILVEFKRSFPDQTNGSNASVVKSEPLQQQQQMENKVFKSNFMNGMSTTPVVKSEAIDLKPPVQLHTFSNFNYYNNPESRNKPITKTIGTNGLTNNTLTTVTSVNPLANNLSQLNTINSDSFIKQPTQQQHTMNILPKPINQFANQTTTPTPTPVYQFNLPQATYQQQSIPSNTFNSPVTTNPLFIPSLTTNTTTTTTTNSSHQINSFNQLNNLNPITNTAVHSSIISSNSFGNNASGLQASNGWYYDSLLVDNVDDFLP